jgi:hypothetical protein
VRIVLLRHAGVPECPSCAAMAGARNAVDASAYGDGAATVRSEGALAGVFPDDIYRRQLN